MKSPYLGSTGTWLITAVSLLGIAPATAQNSRIAGAIDSNKTVRMAGQQHPLARAAADRGPVDTDLAMRGMSLTLRRTAAQQKDLDQLLAEQQTPSSPNYRKWLTPDDLAKRFGASPNDMLTLRQWLEGHGFHVKADARTRSFIRFDGTAEQVQAAFKTEIRRYSVEGVMHRANSSAPSLPAAIAPLVLSVGGMDDFNPQPHHVRIPMQAAAAGVSSPSRRNAAAAIQGKKAPAYNYGSGGSSHALAPGDLVSIYDLQGLYSYGVSGGGQTVVVIAASDITPADLDLYRITFGLPAATFSTVHPAGGNPPGKTDTQGWQTEATLDLEMVSATAPGATLILDDDTDVYVAVNDAIDNGLGQIITMSFGACEPSYAGNSALVDAMRAAMQLANAQGITLIASSGDSGAAGCDAGVLANPAGATHGIAVSLPSSFPEVTAVGGTAFTDQTATYWSADVSAKGGTALGYIPERVWNDTTALLASSHMLAASGGGTSTLFDKPTWQYVYNTDDPPVLVSLPLGAADDGHRDVPDVSLAASGVSDGYVIAMGGQLSTAADVPYTVGGTSASAPAFAGMVAVLNSVLGAGAGTGNINPMLYVSYSTDVNFKDVALGDNRVPCVSGSLDCTAGNTAYGYSAVDYSHYDLATGLGSPMAFALMSNWQNTYLTAPTITGIAPATANAGASDVTVTITGTGFSKTANFASSVNWVFNKVVTPLSSSWVSDTSMTAIVPAANLLAAGTARIQVSNQTNLAASPANYSNPVTFTIANAISTPTISGLVPSSKHAGEATFTLTVNGAGYVTGAVIKWNGTALATTVAGPTQLSASIDATKIASVSTAQVTVMNPDTGASSASTFTVSAAVSTPTITSLSPSSKNAGDATFTLTVNGAGYVTGAVIKWNGTALATTVAGATQLSASVDATKIASATTVPVTVMNLDTGASTASTFTVNSAAGSAAITSLSPASAIAGGLAGTLTVNGTGFVSGAKVVWNSTQLTTTFVSGLKLTAPYTKAMIASIGSAAITVVNKDASTSNASPFAINGPAPKITSVTPNTAVAGGASYPITITGTNFKAGSSASGSFVAGSTVYLDANALTVLTGTTTVITATVPSSAITAAGARALNVTVKNSSTSVSASSPITVKGPAITTLSPNTAPVGAKAFTLTVTGTNFLAGSSASGSFVAGSTVYLGANALTALTGTATTLTATVPATALTAAGALKVTVKNTGTVTSAASVLTVKAPAITTLSPNTASVGASAFTISVTGTNFLPGSTASGSFVAGSTLYLGTTALTVLTGTATVITATVPATAITAAGALSITVRNGAIASIGSALTVKAPAISTLSPNTAAVGAKAFTLTVTGTNFLPGSSASGSFVAGSTVYLGTAALTVLTGTATVITATVPATATAAAAALSVTVKNGAVASAGSVLTVKAPAIAALSPSSIAAGASAFTITVTGTNFLPGSSASGSFVAGSTVYLGSTALTVLTGTATAITATVPATAITAAAALSVTVKNGTIASAGSAFTVKAPAIASLAPNTAAIGSTTSSITINGTSFLSTSTVKWASNTTLTAHYVSATKLTADISSTQLAVKGTYAITVTNGTSTSAAVTAANFIVTDAPVLTLMAPNTLAYTASAATTPISLTGLNFKTGAKVNWGTTQVVTTGSGVSLKFSLTKALLQSSGALAASIDVSVSNPDGSRSASLPFAISGSPAPALTSLGASSALFNATPFALAINGSNLGSGSGATVNWGTSTGLAATWTSASLLSFSVTSSMLQQSGAVDVSVTVGGVKSNKLTFTVGDAPLPTLSTLNPATAVIGSGPVSFSLTGTGFAAGAKVNFGSTAVQLTTSGSGTTLTASISDAQLVTAGAGPVPITVVNPNGMTTTPAVNFTVTAAVLISTPMLSSVAPNSATVGDSDLAITLTGSGFVGGAKIYWGSAATQLDTTGSGTTLSATVPAAQLLDAGAVNVTVVNPDTGATTAKTFTVNAAPAPTPTLTSLSVTSATLGSTANITVVVSGNNLTDQAMVVFGATNHGTALDCILNSTTQLTCTLRGDSAQGYNGYTAGTYGIAVTMNSGASYSNWLTFTVNAAGTPTLTSMTPSSVAQASNAADVTIVITGANLDGVTSVIFGEGWQYPMAFTIDSSTQITCTLPVAYYNTAMPQGVSILASKDGSTWSNMLTFTIQAVAGGPHIDSFTTSSDNHLVSGGIITITVHGTGFDLLADPITLNSGWINWIDSITPTQIVFKVGTNSLSGWGANPTTIQVENPGNIYSNIVIWNLN